jgi:hypothetical protein
VASNPSLFFQISASLIPVLLLAGGWNQRFSPQKFLARQSKRDRYALGGLVSALVAAAIFAEFLAIAEAVSGASVPSAWRTIVVVDVLATMTTIIGIAVLAPWLRGVRGSQDVWVPIMICLLIGSVAGTVVLNNAIADGVDRRQRAVAVCIARNGLATGKDLIATVRDQDEQMALLARLETQIAVAKKARPLDKTRLADLRARRDSANVAFKGSLTFMTLLTNVAESQNNDDDYGGGTC